MKVPDNFIFSASTCALQIEGGRNLGGRTDSIWDEFTKRNYYIPPIGTPGREINSIEVAADFYSKYKTDARIMKKLGMNGLVYNMDWTRVFPKNENYINPEGIKFYDDVFKTLNENGVKPIPILYHWDTPLWAQVKGGWENRESIEWFRNYARAMFKYLGKYTNIWYVNDENSTFTLDGYLGDYLPPQRKDVGAWVKAIHHINLAAAVCKEEFELAKKEGYVAKDALLGIDHDWSPAIPYREEDKEATEQFNIWFRDFWLDPNLKGSYPQVFYDFIKENNVDFEITKSDLDFMKKNTMDLIGWNYYRPCYVVKDDYIPSEGEMQKDFDKFYFKGFKLIYPKKDVEYTKWNWIVDPSQLVSGARTLFETYNKPLMILENGMGSFDDKSGELIVDTERIKYLSVHIAEVIKAVNEGINFIGYSLWTYCDIYSPSGGYRKDYGLVSVDFNSKVKTRKPKLSFEWYKRVIKTHGENLSFDDLEVLKKDLKADLESWDLWLE